MLSSLEEYRKLTKSFCIQIGNHTDVFKLTRFPSPLGLAASQDESITQSVGEAVGKELASVGFNWIFGPILDLLTDLTEPPDAAGRFGDDIKVITSQALAFLRGLNASDIASCAVETLTTTIRELYAVASQGHINVAEELFKQEELDPLRTLVGHQALDSLRLSSIVSELQDPFRTSQSIDAAIRLVLRGRLQYHGPVILDCPAPPPENKGCIRHAPLRALQAGCDMVILSTDQSTQIDCIEAIYQAVASGLKLPVITNAADRVAKLKQQQTSWVAVLAASEALDTSQHQSLARTAYRASIAAASAEPSPLINLPSNHIILLLTPTVPPASVPSGIAVSDPFETLGRALSQSHARIRHVPYTISGGFTSTHAVFISRATAIILVLRNSSSAFTEAQQEFIVAVRHVIRQRELIAGGGAIRKVVLGAGDPRDLRDPWYGWWSACCFDYSPGSLAAAAEIIMGEKRATGKVPLRIK